MKIDKTSIILAKQMAGHVPEGASVIGLVIESNDCYCRNYSALVKMPTGIYVTMIGQTVRSIDQRIAKAAIRECQQESMP